MKEKYDLTFKNTIKGIDSDIESFNSLKIPYYNFYKDQEREFYRTNASSLQYFREIVFKSKNNIDFSDLFLGFPLHSYFIKKVIYDELISHFNLPPHVIEEVSYKVGKFYFDNGLILTFTEDATLYIDFSNSQWIGMILNMNTFENEIVEDSLSINSSEELFKIMNGRSCHNFTFVPKVISLKVEKKDYDFLPFIVLDKRLLASCKIKEYFLSKKSTNCIFTPSLY